tara:strand:- start:1545 stop:1772 length:228 start_codon:yes stop_codon:yes gene_type:complete
MNNDFITIDNNNEINNKLDLILNKLNKIEKKQDEIENKIILFDEILNKINNFICNHLYKFKLFNLFPNFYSNIDY